MKRRSYSIDGINLRKDHIECKSVGPGRDYN